MSILFPRSCFVHIPRTGGTWLQNAATRAEIFCNILKGDIDSHLPYNELPPVWHTRISFSFVRDPLSWIRSRWSHLMEHRMLDDYRHYGVHRLFDVQAVDTFEGTVRNIVENNSGLVSRTYAEMTEGVHCLYKLESLSTVFLEDFAKTEKLTAEQWSLMRQEPTCNETSQLDHWKSRLALPESLIKEFLRSEESATRIWKKAK